MGHVACGRRADFWPLDPIGYTGLYIGGDKVHTMV
jgi:hypothetical protein